MNVFYFFVILITLLYVFWFFHNYVPIKDNRYINDARLTSIVVGVTLFDVFSLKEAFDDPQTIKDGYFLQEYTNDPPMFHVIFLENYFKEYLEDKQNFLKALGFPFDEYLYLYHCIFSNIFNGTYDSMIAKSFQVYEFKPPKKCDLFCNHMRSSFPCNPGNSLEGHLSYDYEFVSFKTLAAANFFLNYKNYFPHLPSEIENQIIHRWRSILHTGKELHKNDIRAIEKCIIINIEFYTKCNLNPLLYSFF